MIRSWSRRDETLGSFLRAPLPLRDEAAGTWRAQLIRRHNSYANGFTTDALPPEVAVPLVRQQLQRLCVDGCSSVLYFEDGHLGPASSYEAALAAELEAGLLGSVTTASSPADFNDRLQSETWNLVVYAHQLSDQPEPYDALLSSKICAGQRALVTETRGLQAPESPAFSINQCAGGAVRIRELQYAHRRRSAARR
jgi:hypothetical protein